MQDSSDSYRISFCVVLLRLSSFAHPGPESARRLMEEVGEKKKNGQLIFFGLPRVGELKDMKSWKKMKEN